MNNPNSSKRANPKHLPITAVVGDIVEGFVANVRHPKSGIIVCIDNNPHALLPTNLLIGRNRVDKEARRTSLSIKPGTAVTVCVVTAQMAGVDENDSYRFFVVSEGRALSLQRKASAEVQAARIERAVSSLVVGSIVDGVVLRFAGSQGNTAGDLAQHGVVVDLGQISGYMRGCDMESPVAVSDRIKVAILSANVVSGKPKILLSTLKVVKSEKEVYFQKFATSFDEQKALSDFLSQYGDGIGTVGTNLQCVNIVGIDGFVMELGPVGVKGFLPAFDVSRVERHILASKSRCLRVETTGEIFLGKYVRVRL
jgi:hypothetical protein